MQELQNLQRLYREFVSNNYLSQTNLNLLQKQRIGAYRGLSRYESVSSEAILSECDGYMEYLSNVLTHPKTPQATFPYTLTIASTMHNPAMKYLSDEEKKILVSKELGMLRGSLRTFKDKPMQYGRKIKDIKNSIKELEEYYKELDTPTA